MVSRMVFKRGEGVGWDGMEWNGMEWSLRGGLHVGGEGLQRGPEIDNAIPRLPLPSFLPKLRFYLFCLSLPPPREF